MKIVLETKGKWEHVTNVKISLFENESDAEKYCAEHTDNPQDEKYWCYCEIIESGVEYEPARYINYKE